MAKDRGAVERLPRGEGSESDRTGEKSLAARPRIGELLPAQPEIDLGREVPVRQVALENRPGDDLEGRAVPLLVEVRGERSGYREVARRVRSFSTVRTSFTPVVARYVRVRALRPTVLHLARVTVR